MPLKILALDTSTEACSAALLYEKQVIERYQLAPKQHTTLILPMLQAVLDEAGLNLKQIDCLAFGRGPGSFTGVRVAASVTQGIALAHDLLVIPISTLRALAFDCYREFATLTVLAAIDARMNEVYWGEYTYQAQDMVASVPEIVCAPQDVTIEENRTFVGVGSGWDSYHTIFQNKQGEQLQQWFPHRYPRASAIAQLAAVDFQANKAVNADQALPIYLRDEVVKSYG